MMKQVYTFQSDAAAPMDERRYVGLARAEYERRLKAIMEMHGIIGNCQPSPDGTGILSEVADEPVPAKKD